MPSKDTQEALRGFGITCPLVVVGRGVDTTRFSPKHRSENLRKQWDADENTRVMLYVGRLSPEKEVQVLIESYANLQTIQPNKTKLVIVGDGPDFARLKSLPEAKGVIFTGSLRGQDLAAAYASADVFVFASQVETFGNVVLEAMASGLPVIAYDYACAHQYLTHGVNGWLSPLGQKNHFIQQIYQLPSVQQLREMGVQACHKVQQSGWQLPVQQLEQAFYQVVKEPSLDFT
mgnify:FL=1